MNILFVCNFPVEKNKSLGGVEAAVSCLMKAAQDYNGNDQLFFFRMIPAVAKNDDTLYENLKLIFPDAGNKMFQFLKTKRCLIKAIENYKIDVINFIGSGPMLAILPFNLRKKCVITQHGILNKELLYVRWNKKLKFFIKSAFDYLYLPFFKNRIFISDYLKNSCNIKYNAEIIPNAVDTGIIKPSYYKSRDDSKIQIVISGNISILKNQFLGLQLIDKMALKGMCDYELKILGSPKDMAYYNNIVKEITNNELIKDKVSIHNNLSREEVLECLNLSDILLVTSLHEHLPVVIAEAMLLGKLVVAPDIGGIKEMISHKINGLIYKRNDLVSLLEIFDYVNENRYIIGNYGRKAFEKADSVYVPVNILEQTIAFFHKLNR